MNQNQLSPSTTGRLVVNVRTADGSIPVSGAKVTILEYAPELSTVIAALTTDPSGVTPVISIETPERALSESPGNTRGYTSLVILVEKEGFVSDQFTGTSVFPGVTTVQPVNLIPLPEFSIDGSETNYFESEAADL